MEFKYEHIQVSDNNIALIISKGHFYNIAMETASTETEVLEWVLHLTEKPWITTDHINEFVAAACRAYSIGPDWNLEGSHV